MAAPRGGLAPWQLRRAFDLMTDDSASEPGLAELAASCGLSTRHFIRAFKASTGKPPRRWLLRHRVDRALRLLAETRLPISEIALACGFSDQSHLTRMFKRLEGTSPALWRRERRL